MSSPSYETSSSEESSGDEKSKVEEEEEDSSEPEVEKEKEKEPEPAEKPEEAVENQEKDAEASAEGGGATAEEKGCERGLLDPEGFEELLEEQTEGWVRCYKEAMCTYNIAYVHLFRNVPTDQGCGSY